MGEKLVNFYLDEEKKKQLDIISSRDSKTIKEILTEQVDEYIKIHGEGNAQFVLDKFTDPDFEGWPAVGESTPKLRTWFMTASKSQIQQLGGKLTQYVNLYNDAYTRTENT